MVVSYLHQTLDQISKSQFAQSFIPFSDLDDNLEVISSTKHILQLQVTCVIGKIGNKERAEANISLEYAKNIKMTALLFF